MWHFDLFLEVLDSLVFVHVSTLCFGMVKAFIETLLPVFLFLVVFCWLVGRSVRWSSRPDLRVSFADAWSVCEVTQACLLSPEPQRDA